MQRRLKTQLLGLPAPSRGPVAVRSHRLVVGDRRSSAPAHPGLQVVWKEPRQPEREVAEMQLDHEAPSRFGAPELSEEVDQVPVFAIVVLGDLECPTGLAEPEEHRSHVVGKPAIGHPALEQGVPHEHVEDQLGAHANLRVGQQDIQRARVVEQWIYAGLVDPAAQILTVFGISRTQQFDQTRDVGPRYRGANRRQYHGFPLLRRLTTSCHYTAWQAF